MGDYVIDAPRSGKCSGSRVRLSQNKRDQRLGLARISRVKGHSQKWQIPARELRRGLVDEARLVTYDADG